MTTARSDDLGPAGLGRMPSMDPKCTPLKHRYDACFNKWFDEYLEAGPSAPRTPDSSSSSASSSSSSSRSSWFSSGPPGAASPPGPSPARRTQLREGYDACAALFDAYKACVRAAVRERDLEPLIKEAREFNPFPFDADKRGAKPGGYNNGPFPFPESKNESGSI